VHHLDQVVELGQALADELGDLHRRSADDQLAGGVGDLLRGLAAGVFLRALQDLLEVVEVVVGQVDRDAQRHGASPGGIQTGEASRRAMTRQSRATAGQTRPIAITRLP
jgi:hypothetical protein